MPKRAAPDHDPMHYRLLISAHQRVPRLAVEETYRGRLAICEPIRVLTPGGVKLKKGTRALTVFYFAHADAIVEHQERCIQRRKLSLCGEKPELPPPSFVWIPLDPAHHLWVTLPVRPGLTHREAVDEALWSPISDDVRDVLTWWVNFVSDDEVPLNYSVGKETQRFARDLVSGEGRDEPPSGLLVHYIGELANDGSVHRERRPELYEFPCLV